MNPSHQRRWQLRNTAWPGLLCVIAAIKERLRSGQSRDRPRLDGERPDVAYWWNDDVRRPATKEVSRATHKHPRSPVVTAAAWGSVLPPRGGSALRRNALSTNSHSNGCAIPQSLRGPAPFLTLSLLALLAVELLALTLLVESRQPAADRWWARALSNSHLILRGAIAGGLTVIVFGWRAIRAELDQGGDGRTAMRRSLPWVTGHLVAYCLFVILSGSLLAGGLSFSPFADAWFADLAAPDDRDAAPLGARGSTHRRLDAPHLACPHGPSLFRDQRDRLLGGDYNDQSLGADGLADIPSGLLATAVV